MYPTQKNEAMLERIILTSSNRGDTVMDCYAGSGGTLLAAHRFGRRFIGMDASEQAIRVIKSRLSDKSISCTELLQSAARSITVAESS